MSNVTTIRQVGAEMFHSDVRTDRQTDVTRLAVCVISGFLHEVAENCAVLGYYAASSGNFLRTFQDYLSVPSSGQGWDPIGCPETSVRNCHYSLRDNPEECRSKANSCPLHFCKRIYKKSSSPVSYSEFCSVVLQETKDH